MRDVYDFAKYFIKNGADSIPNTYDGNMKLQKLLVFADLANIAEYGEPLFNDQVLAFENGTSYTGYHDKEQSVVDMMSQVKDLDQMREIIDAYKEAENAVSKCEIINGVTFYYDGFTLTDDMIDQLEGFSLSAEDDAYSIYLDNGRLVIY